MKSEKFFPVIFIIAILFGMVPALEGKGLIMPLSKAGVYFSQSFKGEVSLYSSNMKIEKVNLPYCGAPTAGLKTYSGDFYLSFEKSYLYPKEVALYSFCLQEIPRHPAEFLPGLH